jgi:hypothetical protein
MIANCLVDDICEFLEKFQCASFFGLGLGFVLKYKSHFKLPDAASQQVGFCPFEIKSCTRIQLSYLGGLFI